MDANIFVIFQFYISAITIDSANMKSTVLNNFNST